MPDANVFPLTKSEFQRYRACPPEFWHAKHEPGRFYEPPDAEALHVQEQGRAVEALARDFFATVVDCAVDFQSTFFSELLLARADVVLTDARTRETTLVEIKSGLDARPDYLVDVAFQVVAAEAAGVSFSRLVLLHVNRHYVHAGGPIDIDRYFVWVDVTEAVHELLPRVRAEIAAAVAFLQRPQEPAMPAHRFCARKLQCPVYRHYHQAALPEYNVFHLGHARHAQLAGLLEARVLDIRDVPDDFDLSEKQWAQISVARTNTPRVRTDDIREQLDRLEFPLYFLDYESVHPAVPLYRGARPYAQMVFQWSLHVLQHPDDPAPAHHEFLSDGSGHPPLDFVRALHAAMPADGGTVVVWNKSFETARNRELAADFPDYADFLLSLNARVFDLMEIFHRQLYLHPRMRGSHALKTVLPILAPEHSYDGLAIRGGRLASITWHDVVTGKKPPAALDDLRAYCKMDTWAMVVIWRGLVEVVEGVSSER